MPCWNFFCNILQIVRSYMIMSGNITSSGRSGRFGMNRINGNIDYTSSSSSSRFFNRESSSMSFSEVNLSMTSIHEGTEGRAEQEVICDKDVWATRMILSALEDLTFEETPFPKLTTGFIQALQTFLLSVNNGATNYNPFVKFTKSNSSLDCSEIEDVSCGHGGPHHQLEISREVMEILENITPETKVIIRTLVNSYVRNSASRFVEMWKPILESNGALLTTPPVSNNKTANPSCELDLKGTLKCVVNYLLNLQKRCKDLDSGIRERLKLREDNSMKLGKDIKEFKEIAVEMVKEKSAQNDPEFVKQYMNYMELEKHCVKEQSRLENLAKDAEENPEQLHKETHEVYKAVKELYNEMLPKTDEDEKLNEQYRSLGSEFVKILEEYQSIEEDITTKEWVKEQLQNGPRDESLFSDSF
ncbi:hypothetical protein Ocin01_06898 [Orchesella cincta]|uniref:Uncharacterized protein n=1 Tax=Orchesella cincta TaxID=48709 RepID=A0A1D2N3D4_ORCCI|nr:hypothetical protein Ocin01_06898 [Orchesella cincta]